MTQKDYLISFDSPRLGYGKVVLQNPDHSGIPQGVTAILGPNGSGKTTLGTILEKGRYAYGNRLSFARENMKVKMLSFTDIHALSGMEVEYQAQRMEATMNDYVPTVAKILGNKIDSPVWSEMCRLLNLHDVADKKINYLSSGELRKLLIINALAENPDILVLDNPYIGLDAASRDEFDSAMKSLRDNGTGVVMLLCDGADIPVYTDAVILVYDCRISAPITTTKAIDELRKPLPASEMPEAILPGRPPHKLIPHDIAFEIRNGHIKYGDREILRDVDWKIRRGERWVLTGPNGCGKSLLLSMVCADNPQGYANDITLFDRRRGSGESIWDIKDAIGYVSPEMQLFFKSSSPVVDIVVQGMRNSLNRYRPSTPEETAEAETWLRILGISHLADRKFQELSSGEQRLALVARALIKQPELLVLDEPLHGLDSVRKSLVKGIVDRLMERNGTSLIFVTHYTSEIPSCVTHSKTLTKL